MHKAGITGDNIQAAPLMTCLSDKLTEDGIGCNSNCNLRTLTKKIKRAVSAHHVHGRQFAALGWKNSVNSYDYSTQKNYATRTNILQEVPKLQACVSHEADRGKSQL